MSRKYVKHVEEKYVSGVPTRIGQGTEIYSRISMYNYCKIKYRDRVYKEGLRSKYIYVKKSCEGEFTDYYRIKHVQVSCIFISQYVKDSISLIQVPLHHPL